MLVYLLFFLFPLIVVVLNVIEREKLRVKAHHDRLLYSLCRVRDETALLALAGKVDQKSHSFLLFYFGAASMIHRHKEGGPCFSKMIRRVDESTAKELAQDNHLVELGTELSQAEPELQAVAQQFLRTMEGILRFAFPLSRLKRAKSKAAEEKRVRAVCQSVKHNIPEGVLRGPLAC